MAVFTGTYQTYAAKGLREQLADVIYNISPTDTPFVSMGGREGAEGKLIEWQTDSLAAAVSNNAQIEGDDITSSTAPSASVRVGNYMQISYKHFVISATQERVDKAGRKSEIAYQVAKKGSELKRDIEKMALENLAGNAGGATTARVTAGVGAWVYSNDDVGTGGGLDSFSGVPAAARTEGTQRAFTETILKSVLQSVWSAGGDPRYLMVGPVNKQKASAFSGVATKTWNMSEKTKPMSIVGAADIYVSDFGFVNIIPNRFQRERDGWVLDPEYYSIAYLRSFKVDKLAKTGDAEKRMVVAEWGLKVKNEGALGLAADLTTT
jgi:hypothetical protein